MAQLAAIATIADAKAREQAYCAAAAALVAAGDAAALKALVDAAVADELRAPLPQARAVLRALAAALQALPTSRANNDLVEEVATHAVEKAKPRVAAAAAGSAALNLDEADFQLRFQLYLVHHANEDFLRAATVLAQARIEQGSACATDEAKAEAFVKLAQTYLKADDNVGADRFVKKAGDHVFKEGVPWQLQVQYKSCLAQVLDAKRRFLEAAQRYFDLSLLPQQHMEEADLLAMLEKAARCIVLAPAGPQRQRIMGTLARDERISAIDSRAAGMLERMYNERFVSPADAQAFEASLETHQKALTSDGSTVFHRAVLEHNMSAAQRVYAAISLAALARRVGIDEARAEKMAAKMIAERRLLASIDQVNGFLVFGGGGGGDADADAAEGMRGEDGVDAMLAWDAKIKDLCLSVNTVVDSVAKTFPQVVPEELRPKGGAVGR